MVLGHAILCVVLAVRSHKVKGLVVVNEFPLMTGFPPVEESQVTLANWRKPPFIRWSFTHVRELIPSANIAGAGAQAEALPSDHARLDQLQFRFDDTDYSLESFLRTTSTDSMVVLRQGKCVYEYYRPGIDEAKPHILMSVSKSVLGLVFGIVADKGLVSPDQPVVHWVPELAHTAYAQASLRDLLDMRVGVKFDENYEASSGPIIEYRKAQNWAPLEPGDESTDLRRFFSQLTERDGQDGDAFHYVSPNTDLLGWILERATGQRFADLVSQLLWQPMGAATDAYITVDRTGAPRCAGGFCSTTRDLARLGQLVANRGRVGPTQVIPESWIDDILTQGDRTAWEKGRFIDLFPDMLIHYRSQWYVLNGDRPLIFGMGVHGQNVFIDPANNIVIAKFSSQGIALDSKLIQLTMTGAKAIIGSLSD